MRVPLGDGHPTGNQHKRKLRWYNCDLESTVNELLEVETMILQQRGHFPEEVETGPPAEEEEASIAEDLEEEAEPAVDLMKEAMAILEDRGMMPLGAGVEVVPAQRLGQMESAMEVDASDSLAAESAEVAMESAAEIESEAKAESEVEAEDPFRIHGLVLKLSPSSAAKKKAEVDEKIKAEPEPMRPKPLTSFPSRLVFEGARRVEPTPLRWNLVQRGMKAIGAAPESASGASASGTSASGASASGASASRLHTL